MFSETSEQTTEEWVTSQRGRLPAQQVQSHPQDKKEKKTDRPHPNIVKTRTKRCNLVTICAKCQQIKAFLPWAERRRPRGTAERRWSAAVASWCRNKTKKRLKWFFYQLSALMSKVLYGGKRWTRISHSERAPADSIRRTEGKLSSPLACWRGGAAAEARHHSGKF